MVNLNKKLRILFCAGFALLGNSGVLSFNSLHAATYEGCKCSAQYGKALCTNYEVGGLNTCIEWGHPAPVSPWTSFPEIISDFKACKTMGESQIPRSVTNPCGELGDCYQYSLLSSCCCTSDSPDSCKTPEGAPCNPKG